MSPQCRSSKQITKGCCTATRSNTSSKAWNSPWVRAWLLIAPYRMGGSADDTPVSTQEHAMFGGHFQAGQAVVQQHRADGRRPTPRLSRLATNCPRATDCCPCQESSTSPRWQAEATLPSHFEKLADQPGLANARHAAHIHDVPILAFLGSLDHCLELQQLDGSPHQRTRRVFVEAARAQAFAIGLKLIVGGRNSNRAAEWIPADSAQHTPAHSHDDPATAFARAKQAQHGGAVSFGTQAHKPQHQGMPWRDELLAAQRSTRRAGPVRYRCDTPAESRIGRSPHPASSPVAPPN